jgi:predicted metal-dependent peptidase
MKEITPQSLMDKARITLAMEKPFYGYLLYRFKTFKASKRIPTIATDGVHLHFNPDWVKTQKFEHLKADLAHAVSSCALGHPFRREDREPEPYNEASDHVINLMLIEDGGFELPPGAQCDSRFYGMSVETVYSILKSEQPQPQPQPQQQAQQPQQGGGEGDGEAQPGSAQPDEGEDEAQQSSEPQKGEGDEQQQGSDGQPDEPDAEDDADAGDEPGDGEEGEDEHEGDASDGSEEGDPIDAPGTNMADVLDPGTLGEKGELLDDAELAQAAEEWESATAAAVLQAEAAGHLSAEAILKVKRGFEVTMSFEEYMRLFASKLARAETSWMRRDRRFAAGETYLPGRRSLKVGKLVYVVDTSGSVASCLGRFEAAAQRVQVDLRPEETIVLYIDAEVCGEERFGDGEEVVFEKPKGGGGTRFEPAFDRVREMIDEGEQIVGMIYITDLEGSFPEEEDVADLPPVLWVSTTQKVAPFGETAYFHNK